MVDQALNAVVGYGRMTANIAIMMSLMILIPTGIMQWEMNGMRTPATGAAVLLMSQGGKSMTQCSQMDQVVSDWIWHIQLA